MTKKIPRDLLNNWIVLVVDDEPDSLEVAERILRFYGAHVHTATDGEQALSVVKLVRPSLIISDLSMPQLDGWGLVFELKQNRGTMEIPVIALTAHAIPSDRTRALAAGFHNYLTKPLTPATFLNDLLTVVADIPSLAIGDQAL
jgi:two-component system, cell cycle response regulator DivK